MTRLFAAAGVVTASTLLLATDAHAQFLGTFTWQLQPFCNVVTVNLTQQGAIHTMDGFDDQCGAGQRAPLVGVATANPDGSIGMGLNIVTVPGGRGVQVDARFTLPTASGSWRDSAGNSRTWWPARRISSWCAPPAARPSTRTRRSPPAWPSRRAGAPGRTVGRAHEGGLP